MGKVRNMAKATKKELKEMIVDLKVENADLRVPKGHCPRAYYESFPENPFCEEGKCTECRYWFLEQIRKQAEKEVMAM